MVASASLDKTIRLWQPSIGRLVRFARLPARPVDIAWSSNGSQLFAACESGRIYLIDPDTVEFTELTVSSDSNQSSSVRALTRAYSLAIHPSGAIALGGNDGSVQHIDPSELER